MCLNLVDGLVILGFFAVLRQIQIVAVVAGVIHKDILVRAEERAERTVIVGGLVVEHLLAVHREVGAGVAGVVHRRDRKRIRIGRGRTGRLEVHVAVVEQADIVDLMLCPVTGVAGRDGDDAAVLAELVQDPSYSSHRVKPGAAEPRDRLMESQPRTIASSMAAM